MATDITAATTSEQDASLRRFRWAATALLVLAGAVFVATDRVDQPSLALQFLNAATEAALVGGLADWFAVTAIFRRPLGLPIPHTAVIPANKERIGIGLAGFIERNFLDPDLVGAQIRSLDVAGRIGGWLADPGNARQLAERIVAILPYAISRIEDREIRAFARWALRRQLAAFEPAPALAAILDVLRQSNKHAELFDHLLVVLRKQLLQNEDLIYTIVESRSHWWVPRTVDRRVAEAIIGGLAELLADLGRRDHQLRKDYEAWVEKLVVDLRTSERMRARVREAVREAAASRPLQAYAANLLEEIRRLLLSDLEQPDSMVRSGIASALQSLGRGLVQEPAMRERVNARAEELARGTMSFWRREIGQFIADVVRGWEATSIAERIERAVGRDLQYIRINGTIVGGLVGCVIFAATHLL